MRDQGLGRENHTPQKRAGRGIYKQKERILRLPLHLLQVEIELWSFENVTVSPAALAWTRRNASIKSTLVELVCNMLLDITRLLAGGDFSLHVAALLGGLRLVTLCLAEVNTVVLLVPLAERGSIDLNDRSLNQCVRANELVVSRMVRNSQDTRLARLRLRAP